MKKEAVYAILNTKHGNLVFYYKGRENTYYLFCARYRRTVYEYFRYGKSLGQLHRKTDWHHKRFISNIIEGQLPRQLKQALKEDRYAR